MRVSPIRSESPSPAMAKPLISSGDPAVIKARTSDINI
jgi:hypothetical protein